MIYFILIILILVFGTYAYAGVSSAPWIPTWKADSKRVFDLINTKNKRSKKDKQKEKLCYFCGFD